MAKENHDNGPIDFHDACGQIHVKALNSSAFTKVRDLQQLVANE